MKALNLKDYYLFNNLKLNHKPRTLSLIKDKIRQNLCSVSTLKLSRDFRMLQDRYEVNFYPQRKKDRAQRGLITSRYKRIIQNEKNIESKTDLVANYLGHIRSSYSDEIVEKIEPRILEVEKIWNDNEWDQIKLRDYGYPVEKIARFGFLDILFNVHYSITEPALIAYYPSLKHYREKREVKTRLGKFLARFKDDLELNDDEIKLIVDSYNAELAKNQDLKFNLLSDDIENEVKWASVYSDVSMVRSCMSEKNFAIRTYCTGLNQVSLAYLTNSLNNVVSRCIVRNDEDSRGYVRFYPSHHESKYSALLKALLSEKGYINQVSLEGVYLRALENEHGEYFAPYIDGDVQEGDLIRENDILYIKINSYGEYALNQTSGFLEDSSNCDCDGCGDSYHEDDLTYVCDYNYCESCLDNQFAYSNYHERYIDRDDAIWVSSQDDYFLSDDSCIIYIENDDDYYHIDDTFYCEFTEENYHIDDIGYVYFYLHSDGFLGTEDRFECHKNDIKILPCGAIVHESEYNDFIELLNRGGE